MIRCHDDDDSKDEFEDEDEDVFEDEVEDEDRIDDEDEYDEDNVFEFMDYGKWEKALAVALVIEFPELKGEYDLDKYEVWRKMILDMFHLDYSKAVKYMKHLWKLFSYDYLKDVGDYVDDRSYEIRADLLMHIMLEDFDKDELYKSFKYDQEFLVAAFEDCLHPKHNMDFMSDYMVFMGKRGDSEALIFGYECYLKSQEGRYSSVDLADLWKDVLERIFLDYDHEIEDVEGFLDELVPNIQKIGPRSKLPLETVQRLKEEEKEGYVNFDDSDEYMEDAEEYDDDIDFSFEQPEKTNDWSFGWSDQDSSQKARTDYSSAKIQGFCMVEIKGKEGNLYAYWTDLWGIDVGDKVLVPFGPDNQETEGFVVAAGKCYRSCAPYDPDKIKTIIKKIYF